MKHYDRYVSLGYDCASTHFLNFWLASLKNQEIQYNWNSWQHMSNKSYGGSFLFDWLNIPINGVLKLFKENFCGLFERENLEITERDCDDYLCVYDKFFDVKFYHFTGIDMTYRNTKGGRQKAETKLNKNFSKHKSKYNYLSNKMKKLVDSDLKILFVIGIVPSQHPKQLSYEEFFQEFSLLLNKINCNAELLVAVKKGEEFSCNAESLENIYFYEVDDMWKQFANDKTAYKSWVKMFDDFMEVK